MKEINEQHFRLINTPDLRTELIQLAAVAVSMVEHMDRKRQQAIDPFASQLSIAQV